MMDWKIKTIETLIDKEITCPCCRKTESFQTIAQRNKIIRSHANCIAGDAISFQVSYYVYPTCSSQCVFCKCEVETDAYKKQQYCEPCLEKARKVFSLNDMIEGDE
tara:strand:+ start:133 stop:450 length:318 start_codon:yes stop_codon:yes gene_type:complete